MATKIFKSDLIANMSPEKRGELLEKLKHLMITMSSLALTKDEDFQKLTYNVTGMKEVFEFIIDNLAGVSEIPKNILLGKSHGVVTAGEYDTLNYYAKVSQFQENKARPIIDKIIDMIIREQKGEIWAALGGQVDDLDWDYEFNTLWVLDPATQADVDLKNAQRDAADFSTGKATSSELRELDPRYSELQTPEAAAIAEAAKVFK
jgi:phage-related protein (TIGR01555 family)